MTEVFIEIAELRLLLAGITAVVSAIVQGYSGFGGGLIIVPILAVLLSPLEAIAITACAAFAGNLMLVPDAMKKAHWSEVIPVSVAIAISIPLGLLFLVSADPTLVRRGMGIFVLFAAVLLMSGWTYRGTRGILPSVIAGGLTGGVTGGFGMPGGPFLVVYFLSAPFAADVQRASIIMSISVGIVFLLAGLIANGAYDDVTIARSVVIVPLFLAGNWLGRYVFRIAPSTWFKKATIGILFATGISVLAL